MRSILFLPGNNPNLLINGDVLGADGVILDLEDAVSVDDKDAARILVRNTLKTVDYGDCEVIIRINSIDEGEAWKRDLEEVVPLCPNRIMPTKVSNGAYVRQVAEYMTHLEQEHGIPIGTVKLIPLIESTLGVENAFEIAGCDPRVNAIFLGAEDLTADMQCVRTKEGEEIFFARSRLVTAARAAGIEVYDTPFTDVHDDAGLLEDARRAKGMGFTGKASISPHHIAGINQVFSPTRQEIQYAKEVLEVIDQGRKQGKGAVSLYGKMIDAPIALRAQRVLKLAKFIYGEV